MYTIPGYHHVDEGVKDRVIALLRREWTDEEIMDPLYVSDRSIRRWGSNFDTYGSVIPPSLHPLGRPRILSDEEREALLAHVRANPDLFLAEITHYAHMVFGKRISASAVDRVLVRAGVTYKKLHRRAAERDEGWREEWLAYVLSHFTAEMIVAVDESSKDDRTIFRHYGRSAAGTRASIPANFVRGERYSVVAALSVDGYIGCKVVEGSVDMHTFTDFIIMEVLPKMNPFPRPRSVLLLDNCQIHKSELLRYMVERKGCVLLFTPPYSPDCNPIEESFSALKAYIRRHYQRFQDSDTPMADLLDATVTITPEKARAWIKHVGFK